MEFSYWVEEDKLLKVGVCDLLGAAVDAIVNPANSGLSHGGGLAADIAREAGPRLENQCHLAIKKLGRIPVTQNVVTTAGDLPFKGVIHAVGPRMGDGDEVGKMDRTITNCLRRAANRGWKSVAFPAISTGLFFVPKEMCAQAFKDAVPRYWKNHADSSLELIRLCLTTDDYPTFRSILQSLKD